MRRKGGEEAEYRKGERGGGCKQRGGRRVGETKKRREREV